MRRASCRAKGGELVRGICVGKNCKENGAGEIRSRRMLESRREHIRQRRPTTARMVPATIHRAATQGGQGCEVQREEDEQGECTPKDPASAGTAAAAKGRQGRPQEKEFLKITDIPKNAWGIKISVRSPRTGNKNGADLDVMLMEPGKLPYYEVAGTIAGCKNCKDDDKIAIDGPHKGKRVIKGGSEVVANYKDCIAGYACQNEAGGFDASAAGDDNTKNEAEKVKHEAKGESFTKEFTLPKSGGGGSNKIMKVYFGGDDSMAT